MTKLWKLLALKKLLDLTNPKIKKIYVNTAQELYSSTDWEIPRLKRFDWMNNYYTITFDNWDELSIWDFSKYQISDNNEKTREVEQINELLEDIDFSIDELNYFIEDIAKSYNIKI